MKKSKFFLSLIALLLVAMMLPAYGCSSSTAQVEEIAGLKAKVEYLEQELSTAKQELKEALAKEPEVKTDTVEKIVEKTVTVPAEMAVGVDCTLNGAASVVLDGETILKAVATPAEGQTFDHWEVDGNILTESTPEIELSTSKTAVVRAVTHETHVLKTINCTFRFLDKKERASGNTYTEFNFEEDYVNPVTKETCAGGKITGYVAAEVPKGYVIDYWMINGVKYEPSVNVKGFFVTELDEATVYELVLVKESAKYYKVSCENCKFSGGGYNGATSGKVKSGTKITVTPTGDSDGGYWTGSVSKGSFANPINAKSFTYTVKSDCSFKWHDIIN